MSGQSVNERWGHYAEAVARRAFGLQQDRGPYHDARDDHGNPWEVKACKRRTGSAQDPGKFFVKWDNHEQLREEEGYYALILYDPQEWKHGPVLAMDVKPARWLDELARPWTANGTRRGETVKRPLWTDVFDHSDISGSD